MEGSCRKDEGLAFFLSFLSFLSPSFLVARKRVRFLYDTTHSFCRSLRKAKKQLTPHAGGVEHNGHLVLTSARRVLTRPEFAPYPASHSGLRFRKKGIPLFLPILKILHACTESSVSSMVWPRLVLGLGEAWERGLWFNLLSGTLGHAARTYKRA